MNVTHLADERDRQCSSYDELLQLRADALHEWIHNHPHRDAIFDAMTWLSEIIVLAELGAVSGRKPARSLQGVLHDHNIITNSARAPFLKLYADSFSQEARH